MKVAVFVAGLLIAAALAWNAAERHYANCLETVKLQGRVQAAAVVTDAAARAPEPTERCSRLPWPLPWE
jgi:hypothetical protein